MGAGVSLILIAVGAVLAWAVNVNTEGVNLNTVGVILRGSWGGYGPWRRETVVREDVYERRI